MLIPTTSTELVPKTRLCDLPNIVIYTDMVTIFEPMFGPMAWPAAAFVSYLASGKGQAVFFKRRELCDFLRLKIKSVNLILNHTSLREDGTSLAEPNFRLVISASKRGNAGGTEVRANMPEVYKLLGVDSLFVATSHEARQIEAVLDEMPPTTALREQGNDQIEAVLTEWECCRSPATVKEAGGLRGLLAKFGEGLVLRAMAESDFGAANSPVAYLRAVCVKMSEAEEPLSRPLPNGKGEGERSGKRKGRKADKYHVASEEERAALNERAAANRAYEEDAVLTSARTARGKLEIEAKILDYQQRPAPSEAVRAWNERKQTEWQAVLERAAMLPILPDAAYIEDVI